MECREFFLLGKVEPDDFIRIEHIAEKVFVDYDISISVQYFREGQRVGGAYDCLSERGQLYYSILDNSFQSEDRIEVTAIGGDSRERLRACVREVGRILSRPRK